MKNYTFTIIYLAIGWGEILATILPSSLISKVIIVFLFVLTGIAIDIGRFIYKNRSKRSV